MLRPSSPGRFVAWNLPRLDSPGLPVRKCRHYADLLSLFGLASQRPERVRDTFSRAAKRAGASTVAGGYPGRAVFFPPITPHRHSRKCSDPSDFYRQYEQWSSAEFYGHGLRNDTSGRQLAVGEPNRWHHADRDDCIGQPDRLGAG